MTLLVAVLPLRLPSRRGGEFASLLARAMDATPDSVVHEIDRMATLRHEVVSALEGNPQAHAQALDVWRELHDYYHCLLDCEASLGGNLPLELEWESAFGDLQVTRTLAGERANWTWNMAVLEAYQAAALQCDNKATWSQAAQQLQLAANWVQELIRIVQHDMGDTEEFLETSWLQGWQSLLMALSQRCVYESLACAPRPRHLLLAKVAAAAASLFGPVAQLELSLYNNTSSNTVCAEWHNYGHAWSLYMTSQAQYHQSMTHREKKQWGDEVARLKVALTPASACLAYCESTPLESLQQLHTTVDNTYRQIQNALEEAQDKVTNPSEIPLDLTEIRGETVVHLDLPLEKMLQTKRQQEPMFQSAVASSRELRVFMDLFHSEMDKLVYSMQGAAEERTESARKALATVNLPHSLTAYRQEQSGGGIPDDLWQRVEIIQRERRIAKLKQELWELRDVAEFARMTYQKVGSQLDFDLESDRLFRQQNPGFEGHDAEEVQKSFRQSLSNYDRLLVTAQEGDSVLLRRLEILDTNPKYKLLQFQKSQLDRLLPGSSGRGAPPAIDTSHLSRLLVELSTLFHEREGLLGTIRHEVQDYDISGTLQSRAGSGSDSEYREAVKYAQASFDGLVYELQNNIEKQNDLVNSILVENDRFMMARERTSNSNSADSCIVMIEDAIEEIEQLSKHLKEGKDFYDVVIPKLEKLRAQVGDVSARLTVERLEFDDKANQSRQLEEDELMAKQMSRKPEASAGAARLSAGQPGISQVNHDGEPQVFVDDEKVATLVAMEFDPAKVVAALTQYNNDVDQALNSLLS